MRFLILSDIHANLEAFDSVLDDAASVGYDQVLVLGDLVGYGADPGPVIERVRGLAPHAMVRGNHDKVCAGLESPMNFNEVARVSAAWTTRQLTPAQLAYLAELSPGPLRVGAHVEICHGAPFDEDYYIVSEYDAARAMQSASARVCLFGHTHIQVAFSFQPVDEPEAPTAEDELRLPSGSDMLINVGSVGQPRDGDPRAAYGILDLDRNIVTLRRVAYDIEGAQRKILQAGLPERLADRLEDGV